MIALDTDRNGELSNEEIDGSTAALKKLDKNQDGEVTRDELRPPPPPEGVGDEHSEGPGGNPPGRRPMGPPPVIAALDTDRDGALSPQEISGASTALMTLDKNGNGSIDHEELCPRPPRGNDDGNNGQGRRERRGRMGGEEEPQF